MKIDNLLEANPARQNRVPDGITVLYFPENVGETLDQIINGYNYPYLIGPDFLIVYDVDAPDAVRDIRDASK